MKARHLTILLAATGAIFLSVYSTDKKDPSLQASKNELLLRKIGHELLRSAGDDTSRVMPVKQVNRNQFQILFENHPSLLPDSIISIVNNSLAASTFPGDYTVNIISCAGKEIVYGFAVSSSGKDDVMPCRGRPLPETCYYIDIRFSSASGFVLPSRYILPGSAIAAVLLAGLVIYYKKRQKKVIAREDTAAGNNNRIKIGKYLFYTEQHYLEYNNVKTVLTNKESKLLYIFSSSLNQIIDRDTLQKEVWENEGVIVTRSLDMFVSKLRKKLQQDPDVKIVNFPGKGYKLEVTV